MKVFVFANISQMYLEIIFTAILVILYLRKNASTSKTRHKHNNKLASHFANLRWMEIPLWEINAEERNI